ncbi:DNA polymerase Y family protein [Rheinheimera sp. FR7-31]|uniref:Y-family DNA polymerase n=1 Tax=Rheinheimera fenheensis TaxID=3152295 RepID=UPI00325C742B
MALYLYLQFPSLLVDCVSPLPAKVPLAVADAQHRMVQLNTEAAACGIRLGMSLGTAAALCADLQLLPYQVDRQQQLLQSVAQQLYQLTADIALDPPDGLYLRLCAMLRLYRGLNGYWQVLYKALQALGYRYQFSCGTTPLAAKCLARQQLNLLSADSTELSAALKRSPLVASELSLPAQQQLKRLGITTLGQLLALAPAELSRRFEPELLSYLGRLNGDFYHALNYIQPAPGFNRYIELLYDIADTSVLTAPLSGLLQQLSMQLKQRDAVCYQLQLSLHFRSQRQAIELTVGSAQGEYLPERWLMLCQLQLSRLKLTEPVSGIELNCNDFKPRQAQTAALFDNSVATLSPLQLVSLLQARLGCDAVSSLCLQNQHLPELASRRQPPQGPKQSLSETALQPVTPLALRPAFILPSPRPLTEPVEITSGPERLCPNGWQLAAQRDYFIGRNHKGQWLWLYRTVSHQWFVHGLFS